MVILLNIKNTVKYLVCALCLLLSIADIAAQQDSTTMSFDQYITLVKDHHPVMLQLELLNDAADGNAMMARGGFDPKIEGSYDLKNFEDKNYYSLINGGLKIPTWYGIEVKAGYDRTAGEYFDPTDFTPTRGLWNAGISIPLGKGLVLDERRATLRQADVFTRSTKIEQQLLLNELLYNAGSAYINWQVAADITQVASEGLQLSQNRYEGTKSSFIGGDKAAIDTLEAFLSVQNRQQLLITAEQNLQNTKLEVESFLWLDGVVPLEMDVEMTPEDIDVVFLNDDLQELIIKQEELLDLHPNIQQYGLKLESLEIDRLLQKEDLKPDLRVYYNPLVGSTDDDIFAEVRLDNYKLGATLKYPLFLRKERGKLKMTDAKIGQASNDMILKKRSIQLQLDQYAQNDQLLAASIEVLTASVSNYQRILLAENQKLTLGESSLFLVNSREQKYVDSQLKQLNTVAKLLKNRLGYIFYTGRLDTVL